jgi:ATP dependent DNA ligase domain
MANAGFQSVWLIQSVRSAANWMGGMSSLGKRRLETFRPSARSSRRATAGLQAWRVPLRAAQMPSFERIRYRRHDGSVFLYAFDLIELNGDDLRRVPLEVRKATHASVLTNAGPGLRLNAHLEHDDGEMVFRHACKLGLEGIVSKRKDSPYRSLPIGSR